MGSDHHISAPSNAGTSCQVDRIFRTVGYGTILLLSCFISMFTAKIVLTSCLLGLVFWTMRKHHPASASTFQSLLPRSRWLVRIVTSATLASFLIILCAAVSEEALGGIIWSLPFLLPLLRIVRFLNSDQFKKGLALAVPMGFLVFFVCKTLFSIAHAWESSWWEQFTLSTAAVVGVIIACTSAWTYYTLPREPHDLRRFLGAFGYPFVVLVLFALALNPEDSTQAIHIQLATRRLTEINKALSEYSKKFDGHFPEDLNALGPPPRNQNADCRAANSLGKPFTPKFSGYIFQYRTGLPSRVTMGGCAGVSQYTLTARPIVFKETGYVNFYTDESAVIHCTFENREATVHDGSFCDFSRHVPN